MNDFDKLLEDVAREWDLHACGDDTCELEGADCLAGYLKRRLLPLLEAGERTGHFGCEDGWYACPKSEDYISGNRTDTECNCGYDNYQAAKQAAMEGRCSTDQK